MVFTNVNSTLLHGNFWGVAKVRLSKFRGMSKNNFYLYLKSVSFASVSFTSLHRFNNRGKNIYDIILELTRENPLDLSKIRDD